jgi:L-amino acid N-acyltransferase YncA
LLIRDLIEDDWPSVRRIYGQGIATGNATFETEAPSWHEWDRTHTLEASPAEPATPGKKTAAPAAPLWLRLVADGDGGVVGWAALSPASSRDCYRGVAEGSVYVDERARGRGLGRRLLSEFVRQSDAAGIWTIQTSIFPENVASVELHRGCGFRVVGLRERIGRLNGVWRDTVLMERRAA